MKMRSLLFALAYLGILLLSTQRSDSFEISAWYDPVSVVQLEAQHYLDTCPKPVWKTAVGPDNDDVLRWYSEMGITNLTIHYEPTDYDEILRNSGVQFGVMNDRWPNRMYQNIEAQGDGIRAEVADPSDPYVSAVRDTGSWGSHDTVITRRVNDQLGFQNVLAIGPGNGTLQEFWRPKVAFGSWTGWAWREFSGEWIGEEDARNDRHSKRRIRI